MVDDEVDEADEQHQQFLRVHYHNLSVQDEYILSNHESCVNEEIWVNYVYLLDEHIFEHHLRVEIKHISFLLTV